MTGMPISSSRPADTATRRYPRVMRYRLRLLALGVAAMCVLAGCGGDSDASPARKTTPSIPAATTSTTVAKVGPVVATTTKPNPTPKGTGGVTTTKPAPTDATDDPPVPQDGTDDPPIDRFTRPGDAARHLYGAWLTGNRSEALRVADPPAVDDLFSYPVPQDPLTPSECELMEVGYGCHWAGEQSVLYMVVEGGASAGYYVTWVSLHRPPVYSNDGVPQVIVRPESAEVGSRVRIDGYGFSDESFAAPAALYLIGGPETCVLYAQAENTVTVREDGYLSGEFIVPALGECVLGGAEVLVFAGHYYIGFGDGTDIIGEFNVTEV